jgi:prepilin-type N-terminal cleavage/methylation domain-containing protein
MTIHIRHNLEVGFTLIELMIASLVLAMGVVSVMSMVLFALSANYASKVESTALHLTQQKLEELKSLPIDDSKLIGPGNPLNSESNIDFNVNPDPSYSSSTSMTLSKFKNTSISFETRWNIGTAGAQKIITVATRRTGGMPYQLKPISLKVVKAP